MAKAPFILNTNALDAETTEIAVRELNETPERTAEAVEQLRKLLHENTDLYYADDDEFLISILRPCHFYPESAIKLVSNLSPHPQEEDSVTTTPRVEFPPIGFAFCCMKGERKYHSTLGVVELHSYFFKRNSNA